MSFRFGRPSRVFAARTGTARHFHRLPARQLLSGRLACNRLNRGQMRIAMSKTVSSGGKPGLLVEALATTLLIAILAAVAVPIYLATIEDPLENACSANMRTIASAEEMWR